MDIPRNTSSESTPLESLGKVFVTLLVLPLSIFMRGWAISTLWNWFVAPPFDAPRLTVIMAVGLSMAMSLFTTDFNKLINDASKDESDWGTNLVKSVVIALVCYPIVVGFGWVVHLFY